MCISLSGRTTDVFIRALLLVTILGGDGGCRVGEVRAGTTSPMPDHKGIFTCSVFSTVQQLWDVSCGHASL